MTTTINASTTLGLQQTADTSGILQLQTASTAALTIDASQNVGIGTSSFTYSNAGRGLLEINGSTDSIIGLKYGNTSAMYLQGSSGAATVSSASAIPLVLGTNNTERARITSNGRTLIAKTSETGNSNLQVSTTPGGNSGITIAATTTGTNYAMLFYTSDGVDHGYISYTTSGTSYNTTSDYRLKENIAPMTGALSVVQQLKPCTYTWKYTGKEGQGFIAHELAEVVPDCVTGEKDAVETYTDEEGNEQTRPKYQGIDTSFLVATLTAAIQEQQALITSLTERIAALENQ